MLISKEYFEYFDYYNSKEIQNSWVSLFDESSYFITLTVSRSKSKKEFIRQYQLFVNMLNYEVFGRVKKRKKTNSYVKGMAVIEEATGIHHVHMSLSKDTFPCSEENTDLLYKIIYSTTLEGFKKFDNVYVENSYDTQGLARYLLKQFKKDSFDHIWPFAFNGLNDYHPTINYKYE